MSIEIKPLIHAEYDWENLPDKKPYSRLRSFGKLCLILIVNIPIILMQAKVLIYQWEFILSHVFYFDLIL